MSLGQIKDYTPNFNLIIPRFDIATWHDYMESNFRSIDALFFNMFGINQYRGEWQNSTTYQIGDVLFIGDPDSQYTGRLIKVLVAHTTTANDSFDVYYAHNPINYDLFMDAAAAEQAAKLARDWAIKTDGKVQGIDYSSKYYANLITPISSEIVNVSSISDEIVNVSSISNNITSVDANSTNINTVAGIKPDIDDVVVIKSDIEWVADNDYIVTNVSNNSTKITTVANNINSVNTNATNITDINTNASNISSINTTATNISNINTTALNINDVNTTAGISNNISIVANNSNAITTVSNNINNVNNVANDLTNINNVNSNKTNIDTVASNSTNINTVSTNISDVNTAAVNITTIQNAPIYATNAANSADLAQDWATKMNDLVDNVDYSSKYYAQIASQNADALKIGQIISSILPLNSAGVHLLDGSLLQSGGIYQAFIDYIANLYTIYPQCFTTEADWQTTVATYGSCGKFVYDSVNNTVRLPKITGFIEGTINSNALGDLVEAGLPNITGTLSFNSDRNVLDGVNGSFYSNNVSRTWAESSSASATTLGDDALFDASHSSSIYGNSNTVQPQSIKVYYYVVIATTIKTDIEVDIDKIVTDLNSKANKDLDNLTDNGKNITNWSNNVTNCIVELPNDVKLELNNGALVVKAGSKFYIPNGSNNFDILTLNNDVSYTTGRSGKQCLLCMKDDGSVFSNWYLPAHHRSDSSDPSSGFYGYSYNTSDNTLYDFRGDGIRGAKCSLPFAIISEDSNSVTGIMQILNGITFCGHTLFVLPGVKALHAEGFNDDGTLKNGLVSINKVLVNTGGVLNTLSHMILRYDANECQLASPIQNWKYWRYRNQFMYLDNGDTSWIDIGTYLIDSSYNSIIKFRPKIPFSSIDYNNTNDLIFQTFPSQNAFQDLTLGASGSTYVAPTNGYVHVVIDVDPNGYVSVNDVYAQASNVSGYVSVYLPIASGKSFYIYYGGYRSTILFKFYQTLGDARYE